MYSRNGHIIQSMRRPCLVHVEVRSATQSKDRRKYLGVICEPVDVRAPLTMYLKLFQQHRHARERESERVRETTTRHRNKIKCNFYYAQWFLLPALSFYKFFAHCPCLVLSCLIFVYGMSSRYDFVCVCVCMCLSWACHNSHTHPDTHTTWTGALAFCYIFAFYGFFIDLIIMLLLVFDRGRRKVFLGSTQRN